MAVKRDFDSMLTIALVVALVAGGAIAMRTHFQDSVNKVLISQTLPEASFSNGIGQHRKLADFKGRVVLVNLWATWSPPCLTELPSLDKLQARLKGQDFSVVAISMNQPPLGSVSAFLEQKDVTHLEAYQDKDKEIETKWSYDGLPVSFLIDRNGNIVRRYDTPQVWDSGKNFDEIRALLNPAQGQQAQQQAQPPAQAAPTEK